MNHEYVAAIFLGMPALTFGVFILIICFVFWAYFVSIACEVLRVQVPKWADLIVSIAGRYI